MNLLTRFNIGHRLGASFALILVLFSLVTALGVLGLRSLELDNERSYKSRYAINFRGSVHDRAITLRDLALIRDDKAIAAELAEIKRLEQMYSESAKKLDDLFAQSTYKKDADERAALARIKEIEAKALPLSARVIELRNSNQILEATALLQSEARPAFTEWLARINAFLDIQEAKTRAETAAVVSNATRSGYLMMGLCAVAIALGAWLAWLVTRSVTRPLRTVGEVVDAIAAGDLKADVKVEGNDETARLAQSVSHMAASLRQTVGAVRLASEQIGTATREIAHGNKDLSSRTEQQASSLQQTSASMEQMIGGVKQNADAAQKARTLAGSASEVAIRGGNAVGEVVTTMDEITSSSRKIADIISVIDGIAFQTNILALNAAVEAARAGEQGRGFAVVAGEVRNLAQRSAQAAREIKSLINESVQRVEDGSKLVSGARETMDEIVSQVKRVTELINEITQSTLEQSNGIGQVNQAVAQLDQMTQQNAALVEQSAAASESLLHQTERLTQAVAIFKLDHC